MHTRQRELLEKRLAKLQAENGSLREKLAALKQENHEARRSLKDHRKLINAIPASIVLIQQGKIVDANEVTLQEFEYTAEELIGRDFLDLFHPDQRTSGRKLLRQWIAGRLEPEEWEVALISKTGATITCEARVTKIRFKGRTAVLSSLTRLEKRRKIEDERLRTLKAEIFTTIAGGLAHHLDPAIDTIAQNTKILQAVLAPLNQKDLSSLTDIESAAQKLRRDLRKLNRFSDRKPDPTLGASFDLKAVVKDALAWVAPELKRTSEDRGIEINLKTYLRTVSPTVGDPEAIRDVLCHMIISAVKAMPKGGELYLTIEENAGSAHIYLQDTGPGVPDQVRNRMADPFGSAKDIERDGVGLSLAYAAVAAHQGDIEVTSKKGQGTAINIRLPLALQEPKLKKNLIRAKLRDARILIVEGEDITRELLSQLLQNRGFMVDDAVTIPEGFKKLKRKKYDFIMVNVRSADVHGDMVLRKIKSLAPGAPIATLEADRDRGTGQGRQGPEVDLVISRPIDMNRAIEQVSEVLIRRFRQRAQP